MRNRFLGWDHAAIGARDVSDDGKREGSLVMHVSTHPTVDTPGLGPAEGARATAARSKASRIGPGAGWKLLGSPGRDDLVHVYGSDLESGLCTCLDRQDGKLLDCFLVDLFRRELEDRQ